MDIIQLLKSAVDHGAADIFIIAGRPITYKINEQITALSDAVLRPAEVVEIIAAIYKLAENRDFSLLTNAKDDDFSIAIAGVSRFRVNAYQQRGSLAAVIRVITFELPNPVEIGIPQGVMDLADRSKGLVLVTGTAGSGKSTTLACMIDKINRTRQSHIITLEDPLEYLHRHQKSIVSQREITTDTESYVKALRASLRQSPDVILLGEMRDYETINVAMTAAETGHLVFSTLHTVGAANTIDRVIDAFPPRQQNQIRAQLSMVLQAVVSQQLLPTVDRTVAPVFEIMIANSAVRNMIRESKIHQIDNVISTAAAEGMLAMDNSILEMFRQKRITDKTAITHSFNSEKMAKKIREMGTA